MTIDHAKTPPPINKNQFGKCRSLLQNPNLLVDFKTESLKLLTYNYAIVLLIANQEIGWTYPFKDVEISKRLGQDLINPAILSKFGFVFRVLTVVLNSLVLLPVITPERRFRNYLMTTILWNIYTIAAIAENVLEICLTMYWLEVAFNLFATVFIVGVFMLCLQTKLTLQVLQYYEYLNYVV